MLKRLLYSHITYENNTVVMNCDDLGMHLTLGTQYTVEDSTGQRAKVPRRRVRGTRVSSNKRGAIDSREVTRKELN